MDEWNVVRGYATIISIAIQNAEGRLPYKPGSLEYAAYVMERPTEIEKGQFSEWEAVIKYRLKDSDEKAKLHSDLPRFERN